MSGVCLTVVDFDDDSFTADVMAQTRAMSTLDDVSEVNGTEGNIVLLQDIFTFKQTGIDAEGRLIGSAEPTTGAIATRTACAFSMVRPASAPAPSVIRYETGAASIATSAARPGMRLIL